MTSSVNRIGLLELSEIFQDPQKQPWTGMKAN